MSTAQSSRPDDDTPRTPGPVDLKGESPWGRMLLVALVVGALFWSVTALLSPDDGTLRQFVSAVLCAGAAVAVQYVLGLAPRDQARLDDVRLDHARLEEHTRSVEEHTRRVESVLAEHTTAVRDGLTRHDDELKTGLTRHTEDVKQLVETHVTQADQHTAESAGARLDPVRIDRLPDLAVGFADVLLPSPSILHTFVHLEMSRVIGHMADLTNLSAECPGENHDWMLTLTRAAEQSILATSTSVDREFWSSEPAGRYLDAQQAAIDEQGVTVRRLFLLESARELDDRLLRLCEEQELRRIDVRAAVLPELPPHLQRGTTNDFILYDEEVSFEIEQDLRDVNVRTRLTARQDYVRDRLKRFRELWDAGMGLRELEVRVDDEEDGNWMVDRA
ncbi:hypothetical protein ABZX60_04140 [Streptomyces olivaceus]|uniref:hypothetical protein n=1 Tax=Streptomyces TaxID=1883 RepID=UPI001CCA3483|nr:MULTISPECIES: hypothetical protein [Streptomyces]MBZ6132284.1 hypothetical protein [Streptomyces olivaceus]MCU8589139.1 hypothetical protein [Streptomyces sp. A13(2022)]